MNNPAAPSVFAMPGATPDGAPAACVFVRRTWDLAPDGRARLAEVQHPLAMGDAVAWADAPDDQPCGVPLADLDVWPSKPGTDVVVTGNVHAPGARAVPELVASVSVGAHRHAARVFGERRVAWSRAGLAFTPPRPFASMPLSWRRAYGGIDPTVTIPAPEDLASLLDALTPERHPGAYPRNPAGTGYVVRAERAVLDGLALPSFEDPEHLLSPDTLVVGDPARWWTMPLPRGFGWFHPAWYPRAALAGAPPRFAPPDDADALAEVRLGLVPRGHSRALAVAPQDERFDPRFARGAAPGLGLAFLRGDEPVRLEGFSPRGALRFDLPGGRPDVRARTGRRSLEVETRLHTVLLEPDEQRCSLVWCAYARLPARYVPAWDDPLGAVDLVADGARVPTARA